MMMDAMAAVPVQYVGAVEGHRNATRASFAFLVRAMIIEVIVL